MTNPLYLVILAAILFLLFGLPAVKVVWQYQRGLVFRFGRFRGQRGAGLNFIIPYIDQMIRVDMRVETLVVEPQEVITRDNVTVQVDAVVYFRVVNAEDAIIKVKDYAKATGQIALTSLRSVLGQSDLDDLLSRRDQINNLLREIIDEHTEPWGVEAGTVEVKDVLLPEGLQRAMARQAEAEREKRAKIIHADGERLAAGALAEAADCLSRSPNSMQLRYLQTLTEVASEHNSVILPIPLDIFRMVGTALRGEAIAPPEKIVELLN
jgi:regulator of protease activity HflC (stomatin/prohibitin superfamily)